MKIRQCVKVFLVLTVCCLLGSVKTAYAADDTKIVDGVSIEGIDVSAMTVEEARETVEEYFERFKTGILKLSFNGTESEKSFEELGITWDNPEIIEEAADRGKTGNVLELYKELTQLRKEGYTYRIEYSLDDVLLEEYLAAEAADRETLPVDAKITRSGKGFKITTESVTGLTVDLTATAQKINEMVQTDWNGGTLKVDAVVQITEPKYKEEDLEQITDCLGEYATGYNVNSVDRSQNLTNGTGFINGVVLLPGESLSLYDYLYPCTVENGYRGAIAYADGGYVDSIGGGICQIATTLYNALLKAELNVTERYPHSMTVSYVDPGWDAALSAGYKDLEFVNDTDYPVYVEAWAKNGQLYTALWGKDTRPANREVTYYHTIISQTPPGDPIYTEDPTLPQGVTVQDQDAYDAIKVELYKQVKIDGEVVETIKLHTDRYSASPAKIRVGTGEVLPDTSADTEQNSEG